MKKNKQEKPLYIEMDINIHCEIKKRAAERNISVKTWVLRAIANEIAKEDKYK